MQQKKAWGLSFEFTAPGTPQQNSVAERRIPTLMGRAGASSLLMLWMDENASQQSNKNCWQR